VTRAGRVPIGRRSQIVEPKPTHLGPSYAGQFQDDCVARRYDTRPSYPAEFFTTLLDLLPPRFRRVMDLGCGTGEVTLGLAPHVDAIDGVDPSAAMLRVARARPGAERPGIRWICSSIEALAIDASYSLIVAADSFHWTDWHRVAPKLRQALQPHAFLALATRESFAKVPWAGDLRSLVAAASTNREYRPFDLVEELTRRGLFVEAGRQMTTPVPFRQSLDDYVESWHTRNGLSRDRMGVEAAKDFDDRVRALVSPHCPDGHVIGETTATVVWGLPVAA
jgi:SAM-dependent methyltransferase